jgi:hypothetical protein
MTAPAEVTDEKTDEIPDTGGDTSTEGAPQAAVKEDGSPYTAADIEALNKALTAARKEARTARRAKPEDGDAPNPDDVARQATEAATGKWKPLVVKAHARTAFAEAGLAVPAGAEGEAAIVRALRLLDLDDLDVADDGHVEGLKEQIEDIRREMPQLFTNARQRPGRVDAADKSTQASAKPKTSAEMIAAALLGGR